MKRIVLNGQQQKIPTTVETVEQLLTHFNLQDRILIVEINQEILQHDAHHHPIQDNDHIEIIHFVGGG